MYFWSWDKMPVSYDKLKEINALLCKHESTHLYGQVYTMRLRYAMKPAIEIYFWIVLI
jgi:peptide deformylase